MVNFKVMKLIFKFNNLFHKHLLIGVCLLPHFHFFCKLFGNIYVNIQIYLTHLAHLTLISLKVPKIKALYLCKCNHSPYTVLTLPCTNLLLKVEKPKSIPTLLLASYILSLLCRVCKVCRVFYI